VNRIGIEFMKNTRYRYLDPSDQQKGLPQPPLQLPPDPARASTALPDPAELSVEPVVLRRLIEGRRSVREYPDQPISQTELSYLLWCTQGVKEVIPGHVTLRTVPSAGARHAFETFLLINRVEGLPAGLYRYLAVQHELETVSTSGDEADLVTAACLGQRFVAASAVTFVWSAVVYRMAWRYTQRGYRYVHLDAGHVCQNLYLAAESIGCGVCAIAAFDDDAMGAALGLDGVEQLPLYVAALGRKKA